MSDREDVLGASESELTHWGYLWVFLSSFSTSCLSKVTGVWEGKQDPEGQRPLPPSVLHSGWMGTVSTGLWHAHLSSRAQLS